jgi:uncharacterized protein (UPF0264 family)
MRNPDARPTDRPRLLVSVRNALEAQAALGGGADIIDVKEPLRGSLGMAAPSTIAEVAQCVQAEDVQVPVSAALGELADWNSQSPPQLSDDLRFLKLGLSQMGRVEGWVDHWSAARRQVDGNAPRPGRWIAVSYVDWQAAAAPRPEEVIQAARSTRCAGVLFDTWSKQGGRLSDWASLEQLQSWRRVIPSEQMLMAVAGRLTAGDLEPLLAVCPDVVGIRSAACRGASRQDQVVEGAVAGFRQALQAASNESGAEFNARV